ncbi:radical SAM/SPASM domain-containing protein [uncultured Bacteroides sp.]|uniref:radical SAM/SPASM domain-containing protein n=1 Tax=uncultured Bacteroides sp. TaxID=162156 RepID=UPI002AAABE6D|nr:radical SAM protein [uncultured Bacteroides sp.]
MNTPNLFQHTKTVVIKTNNLCNLKCTYCYDEDNLDRTTSILNLTSIRSILHELVSYSKPKDIEHLNLIWHGGEPLLMGIDYYSKIVNIQKEFDFPFSNLLQTNATFINEKWIHFFKENNFKIGVSFDGSISANKMHRQKTEKVLENIELLNKNSIFPSIICVISDLNYSLYKEMFDFLSTVKTEYIDLIPCYENNQRYTLSDIHYQEFMIGMFDLWWGSDRKINFRVFTNIIDKMLGTITSKDYITCSLTGRCGEIISINSDKKIYFCDCLPKENKYSIGNLNEGLENISKGKRYEHLINTNKRSSNECTNCEYLSICGKGCLNRRLNNNHTNELRDYYCNSRKAIFNHIKEALEINKVCTNIVGIPAFTRGPQPYNSLN